jgi:hypothetical protein
VYSLDLGMGDQSPSGNQSPPGWVTTWGWSGPSRAIECDVGWGQMNYVTLTFTTPFTVPPLCVSSGHYAQTAAPTTTSVTLANNTCTNIDLDGSVLCIGQ